jgi:tryptophan synthase alpha chain
MGLKNFFELSNISGVDGVIVPDLPLEEAYEYIKIAKKYDVDTIFLSAPTTSKERLAKIAANTSGFLYLVSRFGVTGERKKLEKNTEDLIKNTLLTTRMQNIPLAVGFGLSKPEHINTVIRSGADAAIVGSAFVRIIDDLHNNKELMLKTLEKYTCQLKSYAQKHFVTK